jgi:sigma-B regulation protein RsbU (phosphoserine phosphatase)
MEELAEVLNKMSADLKDYIENLQATTAAKERMESELQLARDIQQSIIPHTFPPFPDIREFDIFGKMIPAKEVAGDFYDYFFIRSDRLGIMIGDVSGKGVPAALFMFMARALIRVYGMEGGGPAKTLFKTNRMLAANNDANMFVTVIYAEYDLHTGNMIIANGGHNPPLLCTEGKAGFLELPSDPILGYLVDSDYREWPLPLKRGDMLLFYTDGVTEAQTVDGMLFGEERLAAWNAGQEDRDPERMCHSLLRDVEAFAQGAPQFDDITLLAFRVNDMGEA